MKSDAGDPAIGIAPTGIQASGTNENDWIALREKLHSVLLSTPTRTTGKTPKECNEMSQFEAQSHSRMRSKELWSQFQAEARANKLSTTAGVKEMLKLKHAQQQLDDLIYASSGSSPIDASDRLTLISAVKPSRFSESDISWRRTFSCSSISSSIVNGRKNDYPGNVHLPRPCPIISDCHDNESGGSLLPFISIRSHDIDDYYEAIRGNTHNILSLYDSLSQDNKASSITFARMFQTLKEGFEQKHVERQQQGDESHSAVPTGGISPIKARRSMLLRSALKPSRFRGSYVGQQRRASWGVGITSGGKNEFLEVGLPPHQPFFVDEDYERNNASENVSTTLPPNKVTVVTSAQIVTRPQSNEESTTLKSSPDEQDSDFNASADEDKSNNGCFEYFPCRSRHKSLESNRSSATSLSSIESSLLVEWSDADELNNGCYKYPCESKQKPVEKSTRSSVTSWSSVGSSLLVEWGDVGESSDDSV